MWDTDLRGLLISPLEMPGSPNEPAHVFSDPGVGPEGRGSAEQSVDRNHRNLAEPPPGGLRLDRNLKGKGPSDRPALKPKLVESLTAEHLDARREIRKRGTGHAPEQEIGGRREGAAKQAAAEPTPTMRITGTANKIAAFIHEGQHVPDDENGADLVRGENQHVAATGCGDASADGVDHAPAEAVVNHPDFGIVGAGALGCWKASILKIIVDNEDFVRCADQRRQHLEHDGEASSLIPDGHKDAEHGVR